jgi:aspartyl-tRNA(Asn)/glutamyl-tRNA(Gln) amidotransferase subunit C
VAVTHDDVRNIAALARLAVSPERLDALVSELNGILAHMERLKQADEAERAERAEEGGMRVAADVGPSVPLVKPISAFAPEWRDGFFLVPRLATHGDAGDAGDDGA